MNMRFLAKSDSILRLWHSLLYMGTLRPLGLQKDIKIQKFVDANMIFEKYEPWAFQNRSQSVYTTFCYNFMTFWSSDEMRQK